MAEEPASPTNGWWSTLDRAAPFESLSALQAAHHRLRKLLHPEGDGTVGTEAVAEQIRGFIARAQNTGTILVERLQRKAAQSFIDYWSAELAGRPDAPADDFVPKLLAKGDPTAATTSEPPIAASAQPAAEPRSREIVRLAATARLWRDSRNRGYLLGGRAIQEASRFAEADADIARLVQASLSARTRKRLRTVSSLGVLAIAVASIAACVILYQFVFPRVRDTEARRLRAPHATATSQALLGWLAFAQRWSPPADPPDLSGATLNGVRMPPTYTLYYPNFTDAEVRDAVFSHARLPNAYFGNGIIEGSTFESADLQFAQFRHARMRSTNLDDAQLYRANFDDAVLCGVSFRGADLRQASFRAVELGGGVPAHFADTAWWLATNWRSDHIKALLATVPIAGPLADAAVQRLKASIAFRTDRHRYVTLLETAPPGIEQAQALNNMAWTLATWGIDVHAAHPDMSGECATAGLPADAVEAADRAVCIARRLKRPALAQVANFVDTRAYLSLQNGRPQEAIERLDGIGSPTAGTSKEPFTGGTLFRYAVAQYAIHHEDQALAQLDRAMKEDGYVPSHELQTLKSYITGAFQERMYRYIDERSPAWRTNECAAQK